MTKAFRINYQGFRNYFIHPISVIPIDFYGSVHTDTIDYILIDNYVFIIFDSLRIKRLTKG